MAKPDYDVLVLSIDGTDVPYPGLTATYVMNMVNASDAGRSNSDGTMWVGYMGDCRKLNCSSTSFDEDAVSTITTALRRRPNGFVVEFYDWRLKAMSTALMYAGDITVEPLEFRPGRKHLAKLSVNLIEVTPQNLSGGEA